MRRVAIFAIAIASFHRRLESPSLPSLTGGRCLPTSAWWPLETPLARFRVRNAVCELALRVCDNVWLYVMVLSCLQFVPACVSSEEGAKRQNFLWGPSSVSEP